MPQPQPQPQAAEPVGAAPDQVPTVDRPLPRPRPDGGANGGEKCGGQLAWIEAVLIEEDETVAARVECG